MTISISVIIPVGTGEESWRDLLPQLDHKAVYEVILAIGEAHTAEKFEHHNISWIAKGNGRAEQMNAAAHEATGEYLWFLHADSRLTEGLIDHLVEAVEILPEALHYHDLEFADDGPWLMWVNALAVRVRSEVLGMPFGDQGFCLSAKLFERLGGFPEDVEYGEDHLLIWKAHQNGVACRRTNAKIVTSARKYRMNGWGATTSRHLWLTYKQAWPEFVKLWRIRLGLEKSHL